MTTAYSEHLRPQWVELLEGLFVAAIVEVSNRRAQFLTNALGKTGLIVFF